MSRIMTIATLEFADEIQRYSQHLHKSGNSVFGYYDFEEYISASDARYSRYKEGLLAQLDCIDSLQLTTSAADRKLGRLATQKTLKLTKPVLILGMEVFK